MSPDSVVITQPVVVDIGAVEKELTDLWRRAAEGELPGVSPSVTRVLLSNLLVYAVTDAEADEAQAIVAEMSADHPTRAVIIDGQSENGSETLEAGLSVLCNVNEPGARLCGELVRIHAHAINEEALGTIIPLLVPELPIYLWTPGAIPTGDEALRSLARLSDHWIIDSRKCGNWPEVLKSASELCVGSQPQLGLHDLAWTGLSHWREIVAQLFDAAPARSYLDGITNVNISYEAYQDEPSAEAVMMAAWLARQLGWTEPAVRKGNSDWLISARWKEGDISIRVVSDTSSSGAIGSVTINAEADGKQAGFNASIGGAGEMTVRVQAPDLPDLGRTIRLPSASGCRSICQVLDTPGRDRLYEKALPLIQSIATQIEEARNQ